MLCGKLNLLKFLFFYFLIFVLKKFFQCGITINIENKEKRMKMDKSKIITKIIAGLMLVLMVFSVGGTLLYYLFS